MKAGPSPFCNVTSDYFALLLGHLMGQLTIIVIRLKGTVPRDFRLLVFSWISFPQAHTSRAVSIFFENSQRKGKMIHEKYQKQKNSWHCPFKEKKNNSNIKFLKIKILTYRQSHEYHTVHYCPGLYKNIYRVYFFPLESVVMILFFLFYAIFWRQRRINIKGTWQRGGFSEVFAEIGSA